MSGSTKTGVVSEEKDGGGSAQDITFRDYFAAQALIAMGTWAPGFISLGDGQAAFERRAEWAFRQADAMLEARKK